MWCGMDAVTSLSPVDVIVLKIIDELTFYDGVDLHLVEDLFRYFESFV